jgi:galactose mutarotase-like enzyme
MGIEISNNRGDRLMVDSLGGKITLLKLNNVLILTCVTRFDGKPGITHPCTPIFGPDMNNVYGLKQHGDMRNKLCTVSKTGKEEITIEHDIIDQGYPQGMKVKQVLKIQNGVFSLSFNHTNIGNKPAEVNAAEHFYFDAPEGYLGATINGQDIKELMGDSATGVVIDLEKESVIHIPGKPKLILKQEGFNNVALWSGLNPATGERDKDYICIEPVEYDPSRFGNVKGSISPGNERTASLTILFNKK